jgi:hypothetical protein
MRLPQENNAITLDFKRKKEKGNRNACFFLLPSSKETTFAVEGFTFRSVMAFIIAFFVLSNNSELDKKFLIFEVVFVFPNTAISYSISS